MLCGGTGGTAPSVTIILTSGLALFSAVGYGKTISYILLRHLLWSVDASDLLGVVSKRWWRKKGFLPCRE